MHENGLWEWFMAHTHPQVTEDYLLCWPRAEPGTILAAKATQVVENTP